MSYIIMEAWLSSFPMIPISLVYNFSGMNDSFMNGLGSILLSAKYPSVQALVVNIFPNITFSATCLYLITEAWLSSFPMIPISLVYSFSEMNDSFMDGVGSLL